MPTVSDYAVLADGITTLQVGGDIDQTYTFSIPSNLNSARQAIVTWQLDVNNPDSLTWQMNINGTLIRSFRHTQEHFGAVQEVIGGSVLHANNNEAQVTVLSGQGQIAISDIAVHYKVNI